MTEPDPVGGGTRHDTGTERRPMHERLTGHPYDPDPGHKRGCFPCCRMAWLLRATPEIAVCALHGTGGVDRGEVIASVGDSPHRVVHAGVYGRISQVEFEAYMHVWATAVPRFSSVADGWTEAPSDPEVIAVVDAMRKALVNDAG